MISGNEVPLSIDTIADILRERYGEEAARSVMLEAQQRARDKQYQYNAGRLEWMKTMSQPPELKRPWYLEAPK